MKKTNATSKSRLLTSVRIGWCWSVSGFPTDQHRKSPPKTRQVSQQLGPESWGEQWRRNMFHPTAWYEQFMTIKMFKFRSSNTKMHTTWLQERSWIDIISMWQSMKSERVTSRFPWSHPMSLVANKSCHLATPQKSLHHENHENPNV